MTALNFFFLLDCMCSVRDALPFSEEKLTYLLESSFQPDFRMHPTELDFERCDKRKAFM